MAICSVFGCRSNNDKRLKKNKDESVRTQHKFFKFPKDKDICKIWLEKCKKAEKINTKNATICSRHFKPEHFVRCLQDELLSYSPKRCRRLKPDAIPTENLPAKPERTQRIKFAPEILLAPFEATEISKPLKPTHVNDDIQMEIEDAEVDAGPNDLDANWNVEYLLQEHTDSVTSYLLKDLTQNDDSEPEDQISGLEYDGSEHLGAKSTERIKDKIPNVILNYCNENSTSSAWNDKLSEELLIKPSFIFIDKIGDLEKYSIKI